MAATNNGSATRSSRMAQKYFDQYTGPTTTSPRASARSATPTVRSKVPRASARTYGCRRDTATKRTAARNGTRIRSASGVS